MSPRRLGLKLDNVVQKNKEGVEPMAPIKLKRTVKQFKTHY